MEPGEQVARVSSGISTRLDGLLGEAERAGEPVVLVGLEQALAAGLLDERGDLLAGEARASPRPWARCRSSRSTPLATMLMTDDHRAQHRDDHHHRRAEHERGAVGAGERDVLGHHLAEHDVQVDHDRHARPRTTPGAAGSRAPCAAWNSGSSRWATAGSPTAPRPSEQTVMPSWAPAITSETFSIARSVVRAAREPAWARGSIWLRRAETRANSAPTKNALKASRTTARTTRGRSLIDSLLARPAGPGSARTEVDAVDAQAVHVLDPVTRSAEALARLVGVGCGRAAATSTRRRPAGSGRARAGPGPRRCRSPRARAGSMPVTSSTSSGRSRPERVQRPSRRWRARALEPVVLVGDVADDLLDDVLERHDAGVAAVLVEHDGHLEAVAGAAAPAAGRAAG